MALPERSPWREPERLRPLHLDMPRNRRVFSYEEGSAKRVLSRPPLPPLIALNPCENFRGRNLENPANTKECVNSGRLFAVLEMADVGAIQPGVKGQFLLAQSGRMACFTKFVSQHAREPKPSTLECLWTIVHTSNSNGDRFLAFAGRNCAPN